MDKKDQNKSIKVPLDDVIDLSDVIKKEYSSNNIVEFNEIHNGNADPHYREEKVVNERVPRIREKRFEENFDFVPLDSSKAVSIVESIPAYKRRKVQLDSTNQELKNSTSRLSINVDYNDQPIIEKNNSFFDD